MGTRYTKQFEVWFARYGVRGDERWLSTSDVAHVLSDVKRIAWRAYQRGRKDGVSAVVPRCMFDVAEPESA